MKIFTCTGSVDLDMEVVETDHDMCNNCKSRVINAMQEKNSDLSSSIGIGRIHRKRLTRCLSDCSYWHDLIRTQTNLISSEYIARVIDL